MKCSKVRRRLPLHAGGDLPSGKAAAVVRHLVHCSRCRDELKALERSREILRRQYGENRLDWGDDDWNRLVSGLSLPVSRKGEEPAGARFSSPAKWMIPAAAAAAALMLILFFLPHHQTGGNSGRISGLPAESLSQFTAPESQNQDVISMTFFSQESGLKIVWILDKNFNLEESHD